MLGCEAPSKEKVGSTYLSERGLSPPCLQSADWQGRQLAFLSESGAPKRGTSPPSTICPPDWLEHLTWLEPWPLCGISWTFLEFRDNLWSRKGVMSKMLVEFCVFFASLALFSVRKRVIFNQKCSWNSWNVFGLRGARGLISKRRIVWVGLQTLKISRFPRTAGRRFRNLLHDSVETPQKPQNSTRPRDFHVNPRNS